MRGIVIFLSLFSYFCFRRRAAKLLGNLTAYIVRPVPGLVYTPSVPSPLEMLLSKTLVVPQLTTASAYQVMMMIVMMKVVIMRMMIIPASRRLADRHPVE